MGKAEKRLEMALPNKISMLGMKSRGEEKIFRVILDYDLLNAKDAVKKILKSKLLVRQCKHERDFFHPCLFILQSITKWSHMVWKR